MNDRTDKDPKFDDRPAEILGGCGTDRDGREAEARLREIGEL